VKERLKLESLQCIETFTSDSVLIAYGPTSYCIKLTYQK